MASNKLHVPMAKIIIVEMQIMTIESKFKLSNVLEFALEINSFDVLLVYNNVRCFNLSSVHWYFLFSLFYTRWIIACFFCDSNMKFRIMLDTWSIILKVVWCDLTNDHLKLMCSLLTTQMCTLKKLVVFNFSEAKINNLKRDATFCPHLRCNGISRSSSTSKT